jgi:hypothetical protein
LCRRQLVSLIELRHDCSGRLGEFVIVQINKVIELLVETGDLAAGVTTRAHFPHAFSPILPRQYLCNFPYLPIASLALLAGFRHWLAFRHVQF